MAQLGQNHNLLQTIIDDIATETDPLPNPSSEAITSVVLRAQVEYLKGKLASLDTEIQSLRRENASLHGENSFLRFENDLLFDRNGSTQKHQFTPPTQPDSSSTNLISLAPDVPPNRKAHDGYVHTCQKVKLGAVECDKAEHQVDCHVFPVESQLEAESPGRTDHQSLGGSSEISGSSNDGDAPSKEPLRVKKPTIALQHRTVNAINKSLNLAAQAENQNTALLLTCLPPHMTYRQLFHAISLIRPGRVKSAEIRKTTVNITFFTHEAAEKLHNAIAIKGLQPKDPTLHGGSVSWSRCPVPPEDPRGRTRVLDVEARPGYVTAKKVMRLMHLHGSGAVVESITAMPPQSHTRPESPWRGPFERFMCRFRSVKAAEMAREVLARAMPDKVRLGSEYLPDPCE